MDLRRLIKFENLFRKPEMHLSRLITFEGLFRWIGYILDAKFMCCSVSDTGLALQFRLQVLNVKCDA